MTKKAHITSRPETSVGDEVVGLCGKVWTITTAWDDIPKDHPICRTCVDVALVALTDADMIVEGVRRQMVTLTHRVTTLANTLSDEGVLDEIHRRDAEHMDTLIARAEAEREARTCTCTWESPDNRVLDDDCPIHTKNGEAR